MMFNNLTILAAMLNFASLILLSFLMLSNPFKVNRKANIWFGLFHLFWSLFWVDEVANFAFNVDLHSHWRFIFSFFQYFTPMLFYFSIVFYTNPGFNIKKEILLHLVFPFFYLSMLYIFYFVIEQSAFLNYAMIILLLSQSLFYALASFFRIRKHKHVVQSYASDTREVDLFWLERIIVVVLLILVVAIIYNIVAPMKSLNLFMNIVLLLLIFNIAYHAMRQKEIYPFSEAIRDEVITLNNDHETEESKAKLIRDEELIPLKTQLNKFIFNTKPYLDPDLNLVKLAELFGIAPHRLSYLINTGYNMNFFNFINSFRIDEAKAHLLDPKMNHFSIMGMAYEAGFNSKTAFNSAFKKCTGLTPTEFKKRGLTL